MLLKFSSTLALLVAFAHAEAPLNRAAPYAAAGWRPRIPFKLPGELADQEQVQPQAVDIEVSKERVNFVGQIADNGLLPQNEPQNSYLPPERDVIITQGLPNANQAPVFNTQQPQRPIFQRPQGERPILQPRPQPQWWSQRPRPPVQCVRPTQPPRPAVAYGPPTTPAQDPNNTGFTIVYPDLDPRSLEQPDTEIDGNANDEDVVDLPVQNERTPIEELHAVLDAYYENQRKKARGDQPQPQVASAPYNNLNEGRYYILTPENTLQRVSYRTAQDSEDARANGFTAQLKYATVGEVKDPIYKYNNEGQLVRLLK